jgi:chromosome partitioning protein
MPQMHGGIIMTIIVIGNEKGGAGKTTTAMHIIGSLLEDGYNVGTIDLDLRQMSLSRYLYNRALTIKKYNIELPMPTHYVPQDNESDFLSKLDGLREKNDFVVIDTPGSNHPLSSLAHSYADMIVTPVNDSFIDIDLLANIEADTLKIERPSLYSQMVWEQKINKAKRNQGSIDWVVVRNRLSHIDAKNKRNVHEVLQKLSARIGYRLVSGLSERVIFRELFLQGLTLLDLNKKVAGLSFTISNVAARQELREFMKFLNLKQKIIE